VFRLQSDSAGRTVVHDADGHEVVGIRQGHVAKRSGRRLETTMVGGPGVTVQQAQRKGEPADTESAMSAADFVVAVQRKARAGSVLRSVMPGEKTALDLGGRAEPMPTNPPAAGPVARPASGSVALPLPYPQRQPASADAR
jgi:hypothetical protein